MRILIVDDSEVMRSPAVRARTAGVRFVLNKSFTADALGLALATATGAKAA